MIEVHSEEVEEIEKEEKISKDYKIMCESFDTEQFKLVCDSIRKAFENMAKAISKILEDENVAKQFAALLSINSNESKQEEVFEAKYTKERNKGHKSWEKNKFYER